MSMVISYEGDAICKVHSLLAMLVQVMDSDKTYTKYILAMNDVVRYMDPEMKNHIEEQMTKYGVVTKKGECFQCHTQSTLWMANTKSETANGVCRQCRNANKMVLCSNKICLDRQGSKRKRPRGADAKPIGERRATVIVKGNPYCTPCSTDIRADRNKEQERLPYLLKCFFLCLLQYLNLAITDIEPSLFVLCTYRRVGGTFLLHTRQILFRLLGLLGEQRDPLLVQLDLFPQGPLRAPVDLCIRLVLPPLVDTVCVHLR